MRDSVSRTALFRWKGIEFESLWMKTIEQMDRFGPKWRRTINGRWHLPSGVRDIGCVWTKRGSGTVGTGEPLKP